MTGRSWDWLQALRIQQWLKNLLLFAPAIAAHRIGEPGVSATLCLAFLAFGLAASGGYLLNDLLDLESDRRHPRKRARPLASGRLPLPLGAAGALLLPAAGLILAALVGRPFLLCVLLYLALTCSYSLYLKRLVPVDCFALAMLYTLRIIAGAAAIAMGVSFWLLAFSLFLFLSLAFVKRYAEIEVQLLRGEEQLHGRGYLTGDAALVQTFGIAAGFAAALVLSLYLNSAEIQLLYASPRVVWGAVVILLFWISWMWLQAHRGRMHDDPLVFAVKDPTSLACGALFVLVALAGAVDWRWPEWLAR